MYSRPLGYGVDTAWNLQANLVQMPDARFWYKCTNASGDKAFAEDHLEKVRLQPHSYPTCLPQR